VYQAFTERPVQCMHYHWPTTGLPLAYHWPTTGLPLAYHWPITGLSLAYHWPTTGLSLAYHWPTTGTTTGLTAVREVVPGLQLGPPVQARLPASQAGQEARLGLAGLHLAHAQLATGAG
jgi:hypothetical protein